MRSSKKMKNAVQNAFLIENLTRKETLSNPNHTLNNELKELSFNWITSST